MKADNITPSFPIKTSDVSDKNKRKKRRIARKRKELNSIEIYSPEYIDWILSALPDEFHVLEKERIQTALLIENVYACNNPHNHYPDAIAISCDTFRRNFANRDYIKRLKQSVINEVGNGGYWNNWQEGKKHIEPMSKGYRLAPEIESSLTKLLCGNSIKNTPPVRKSTVIAVPDIKDLKAGINVWVPINLDYSINSVSILAAWITYYEEKEPTYRPKMLRKKIVEVENKLRGQHSLHLPTETQNCRMAERLKRDLMALRSLIDQAQNSQHPGKVLHHYEQKPCGRIYAKGGTPKFKTIGLQTCTSLVRNICFKGFYSYDIESCNHAIALQYARDNKLRHKHLAKLVKNKTAVRKKLATECNITINQVKQFLTALIHGARVIHIRQACYSVSRAIKNGKCSTDFDLVNIAGVDRYSKLIQNPFIAVLAAELKDIYDHVAENASEGLTGALTSPVNAGSSPVSGSTKKKPEQFKATRVAAYFQQIEYRTQQEMINQIPSVVFTIHDEVVSTESVKTKPIEKAVFKAIKHPLKIEKNHL